MLLVGYFEGIDSERGIAWRCSDSLALRDFLGLELSESAPDHSTISRTRRLLDSEVHAEVFAFVLRLLSNSGLVDGKRIGVDATTLEANAAMKSLVRRDTGQAYEDFLKDLAESAGEEAPTKQDLARMDRKRPKKGSNADWVNPHDPDAQVTKLKDGRTHLAHKAEHAVDLDSGAIVGCTVQPGAAGDTTTIHETISYISEPNRGRRRWAGKEAEKEAVYGNRRRMKGQHGRALYKKRSELTERSFAHCLDTGGMRRVHLRGRENIEKRYLLHAAAFNLGILMRSKLGVGTPRGLQGALRTASAVLSRFIERTILLFKTYRGAVPKITDQYSPQVAA